MTYYEKLVKNVHAAMQKHPKSPVVMTTDDFRVVCTGGGQRKIASAVKKCRAEGHVPAVFQKPDENQTFVD
jgi:hypothetical protein